MAYYVIKSRIWVGAILMVFGFSGFYVKAQMPAEQVNLTPSKVIGLHAGVGYFWNTQELQGQSLIPRQSLTRGIRYDLMGDFNIMDYVSVGLHHIGTFATSDMYITRDVNGAAVRYRERQGIKQQYFGLSLAKAVEITDNLVIRPYLSAGLIRWHNDIDSSGYQMQLMGMGLAADMGFSLQYFLTHDFSLNFNSGYFLGTIYGMEYISGRYTGAFVAELLGVSHYTVSLGLSYYPFTYSLEKDLKQERSKEKVPNDRFY